jgi:hypothetical protein
MSDLLFARRSCAIVTDYTLKAALLRLLATVGNKGIVCRIESIRCGNPFELASVEVD